jgi:hypothetical protein
MDQLIPLIHQLPINYSSKSKLKVYSIPCLTNYDALFINYRVYTSILNRKGACLKPLIFPESNLSAIAYMSFKAHLSSLSCPTNRFPKGAATPQVTTEEVGATPIVLMVYDILPELILIFIMSLNPRRQKTHV